MPEPEPLTDFESMREALQRSEAKYWDLFDSLPDPAWIFDRDTLRFLAVNAAALERYGWSRQEFLGLTVMDIRPEEEVEKLRELFKDFPARREMRGQWRHRTKSGETFFVEVTSHAIDFEGRPCRITVVRDISDRVEAWEALGRTEERYRDLIGSMHEGVLMVDAEGRVVFGNPACRRILDIPDEPLEGMDFIRFVDPEYTDLVMEERRTRRGGQGSTYELKLLPVHGRPRWVSVRTSPRFNAEGAYTGAFIIFSDITEQRAMVEALRAGEERYRSVIEQAGDMIFLLDMDTKRVVQSNPAFRERLGYQDPEGTGLTLYDLVAADRDSVDRNMALVRSQGHHHVGLRQYRHADGSMRDVEVGATALIASGQPLMAVVARDVTEQLRSELALQQAQKLESLGLLAGGVAHDFNNLLTAMLGNLNLAQHKLGPASPAGPHLLSLEKTLLKAAELTRQMLAYSGKGRFVVKAVDLNQAVEEMARLLEVSIPGNVALRSELGPGLPAVEADPVQLQQVLMNLVANAADAIGEGEGSIRLRTSHREVDGAKLRDFQGRALPQGRFVVLEVADTGCGMDAEVMARIFEPFFTTKASGRGLGLGAMLGILKGHNARLQVDSEAGRGSTFRIFFPASQRSLDPGPAAAPEFQSPQGLALVVDDEPDIRHAAASLFGVLGFRQVLEAGDGEEALACFQAQKDEISVVFMDLTMPRLSGREAFLAMRELNPDVKVILTSGYTEQEAFRDFGAEAPFAFLQKPYRFKQLREVVQQAIQQGA